MAKPLPKGTLNDFLEILCDNHQYAFRFERRCDGKINVSKIIKPIDIDEPEEFFNILERASTLDLLRLGLRRDNIKLNVP